MFGELATLGLDSKDNNAERRKELDEQYRRFQLTTEIQQADANTTFLENRFFSWSAHKGKIAIKPQSADSGVCKEMQTYSFKRSKIASGF